MWPGTTLAGPGSLRYASWLGNPTRISSPAGPRSASPTLRSACQTAASTTWSPTSAGYPARSALGDRARRARMTLTFGRLDRPPTTAPEEPEDHRRHDQHEADAECDDRDRHAPG